MASASLVLQNLLGKGGVKQVAGPVLIILILSMMVLPLPPFLLDLFFTFNIAISVIVMLVAINVMKPLDFSVFPTVLLVTTATRTCACSAVTSSSAPSTRRRAAT